MGKTLCLEPATIMQTLFWILVISDAFVRKTENLCRLCCGILLNMHASQPFIYRHFRGVVQVCLTFCEFFSGIFRAGLHRSDYNVTRK